MVVCNKLCWHVLGWGMEVYQGRVQRESFQGGALCVTGENREGCLEGGGGRPFKAKEGSDLTVPHHIW